MSGRHPLIHGLVVYGDDYCDLLQQVLLPSLLAPGNLPAVSFSEIDQFVIYTRQSDAGRLKDCQIIGAISRFSPVRFVIIDDVLSQFHDRPTNIVVSHCHRSALKDALDIDAGHCIWCPDFVISDGFLGGVMRHANQGARAVLISANRADREKMFGAVDQFRDPSGRIAIPSRDLVRIVLKNPHPGNAANEIDAQRSSPYPSGAIWPVGDEGWMIMAWMHHPIYVRPKNSNALEFSGSVDSDLVDFACNPDEIAVIEDSDDDGVCVELSPVTGAQASLYDGPLTPERMAVWAAHHAHAVARSAVHRTIHIVSKRTPELWQNAAQRLETFKSDVFGQLTKLDVTVGFMKDPMAVAARVFLQPRQAARVLGYLREQGIEGKSVTRSSGRRAALAYLLIWLSALTALRLPPERMV